jgi:hypothetical protein
MSTDELYIHNSKSFQININLVNISGIHGGGVL